MEGVDFMSTKFVVVSLDLSFMYPFFIHCFFYICANWPLYFPWCISFQVFFCRSNSFKNYLSIKANQHFWKRIIFAQINVIYNRNCCLMLVMNMCTSTQNVWDSDTITWCNYDCLYEEMHNTDPQAQSRTIKKSYVINTSYWIQCYYG